MVVQKKMMDDIKFNVPKLNMPKISFNTSSFNMPKFSFSNLTNMGNKPNLAYSKPISNAKPIPFKRSNFNMPGASIPMQQRWRAMPLPQKIIYKSILPDSDKDGVPNKYDCRPFNPKRQDDDKKEEKEEKQTGLGGYIKDIEPDFSYEPIETRESFLDEEEEKYGKSEEYDESEDIEDDEDEDGLLGGFVSPISNVKNKIDITEKKADPTPGVNIINNPPFITYPSGESETHKEFLENKQVWNGHDLNNLAKFSGKKYSVSNEGMKKGYYKIVDEKGVAHQSGLSSKKAAEEITEKLNKDDSSLTPDYPGLRKVPTWTKGLSFSDNELKNISEGGRSEAYDYTYGRHIKNEVPEEHRKGAAEELKERNKEKTVYRIWDRKNKNFVSGPIQSKTTAKNKIDKLDNEYGSYNYGIKEIKESETPRQLPIIHIDGTDYFVDERLNEIRNVKNPHDREKLEGSADFYIKTWGKKK
jgi:hypothetical protein